VGVGAGLKPAPMERAKLSVLQTSVYKSVTELTSQYNRLTTNGPQSPCFDKLSAKRPGLVGLYVA
jgi:hypothetical protein